jgi:hypothetical protein
VRNQPLDVAACSGSEMHKQSIILLFAWLLASCATAPEMKSGMMAWDGLGRYPNPPSHKKLVKNAPSSDTNIERERTLATFRPYSEAWWVVHDEIEVENDRQLGAKLVICRGCFDRVPPNATAQSHEATNQ